eukprot:scaffold26003_cov96-Skeletonema_dohrnii-CCMP3373.AAC.1
MALERELAVVSDASSGHLRRCSDADTTKQCLSREKDASILSRPTIMERELAVVSDASSGHLRRCSDADTTKQCLSREKDASILSWRTLMGH